MGVDIRRGDGRYDEVEGGERPLAFDHAFDLKPADLLRLHVLAP